MIQISDPRAPFANIDAALSAAEEFVRREGGSFVGAAAERQPGGYFVRVRYQTQVGRGGRAGRKRWQAHTVEIGRVQ